MEALEEGKLIRERVGARSNSAKVKQMIAKDRVESNSFLEPRDFTRHQYSKAIPRKGTTSASRVAKG